MPITQALLLNQDWASSLPETNLRHQPLPWWRQGSWRLQNHRPSKVAHDPQGPILPLLPSPPFFPLIHPKTGLIALIANPPPLPLLGSVHQLTSPQPTKKIWKAKKFSGGEPKRSSLKPDSPPAPSSPLSPPDWVGSHRSTTHLRRRQASV